MISRRDFLKSAGVAALAVATTGMLAGCSVPTNPDAPAPSEPETPAASNTVTLADGVTLTILGTTREKVLPNGDLQYLAVKFKLNNESKKNVTITENNFKTNLNGKWEFPVASDKLTKAQKQFLERADVPYIGYYSEGNYTIDSKPDYDPDKVPDMNPDHKPSKDDYVAGFDPVQTIHGFGTAGTDLEAAVVYMTRTTESKMDLVVTYEGKVFKFNLAV